ncbi:MAG: glutathione S-transferase [Leptolyngbyaceae cyanobacterium SU_3_3]|nr:glutathione S-transferase [Leptolyngbyaceae cyanobacterium SU_3_3]NJR52667.1 glutathione S-transferase [Leptolyngbyaceae cyanobacterium CSU_1_3]
MNLYFAPLACSLATRIALYESGIDAQYTYVDLKAKRLADGTDFFQISPLGQVPALQTQDNLILTENAAILQYVADHASKAALAPTTVVQRSQLHQWLSFIGTELHKAVFVPLLDPNAPEAVKAYTREKIARRFEVLQSRFSGQEFLLDCFTIADAYLVTVLNWAKPCNIDLTQWSAIHKYYRRLLKRESVAKAVKEEWSLYQEEQARYATLVK